MNIVVTLMILTGGREPPALRVPIVAARAFSSEVGTGSREENASK
jgi:hypothetical protein